MRRRTHFGLVVLVSLISTSGLFAGDDMPVSGKLQGSLFKKIFSYDKSLIGDQKTKVFIIGADREDEEVIELVQSFLDVEVFPVVIEQSEITGWISPRSVIYVMPGADKKKIKKFCAEGGILSISGFPSFAEDGHVSVSVDKNESGTHIVVNLKRLKTEGHEFSSDLLKLARIVR